MKNLLFCLFLFVLSGCSTLAKVTGVGAEINDEALNAAEFTICHGASIGSIRRHYGTDEKSKIWSDLCNAKDDFNPKKTR